MLPASTVPRSDVEEDGLASAVRGVLQPDIQGIDGLSVAFAALGDQRIAAHLPLDRTQQRVGGVGVGLVVEVERVCRPTLMPRANNTISTCGAWVLPLFPGTAPGLMVSNV